MTCRTAGRCTHRWSPSCHGCTPRMCRPICLGRPRSWPRTGTPDGGPRRPDQDPRVDPLRRVCTRQDAPRRGKPVEVSAQIGALPRTELAEPTCRRPFDDRAYHLDLAVRRARAAAGDLTWSRSRRRRVRSVGHRRPVTVRAAGRREVGHRAPCQTAGVGSVRLGLVQGRGSGRRSGRQPVGSRRVLPDANVVVNVNVNDEQRRFNPWSTSSMYPAVSAPMSGSVSVRFAAATPTRSSYAARSAATGSAASASMFGQGGQDVLSLALEDHVDDDVILVVVGASGSCPVAAVVEAVHRVGVGRGRGEFAVVDGRVEPSWGLPGRRGTNLRPGSRVCGTARTP